MKKSILLVLLSMLMVSGGVAEVAGPRFAVNITFYAEDNPVIHDVTLTQAARTASFYETPQNYSLVLVNGSDQLLTEPLPIVFSAHADPSEPGDPLTFNIQRQNKLLYIPYWENRKATRLVIKQNGRTVAETSLVDAICTDDGQCPASCTAANDPDCEKRNTSEAKEGGRGWLYWLIGFLLAGSIGGYMATRG